RRVAPALEPARRPALLDETRDGALPEAGQPGEPRARQRRRARLEGGTPAGDAGLSCRRDRGGRVRCARLPCLDGAAHGLPRAWVPDAAASPERAAGGGVTAAGLAAAPIHS